MKRELFFGIDLGTSNCSVAFVIQRPQRDVPIIPKVVEFGVNEKFDGKEPRFPSVVCKNPRSPKILLFGFAAEKYGNNNLVYALTIDGSACYTIFSQTSRTSTVQMDLMN